MRRFRPCLRECQCRCRPESEGDDEERLDGMENQYEVECLVVLDTVEDEHRFHGEVPRAGTVRGGHDDGDGADDEDDHDGTQPKAARGREAEEGQVEVQEVAAPDGEGEEQEQPGAADVPQGDDSLPDASQGCLHLII